VNDSVLLTDSDEPALDAAIATIDGWSIERVRADELESAVATLPGVRAVLIESDDPAVLRSVVERAHGCGIPTGPFVAGDAGVMRTVTGRSAAG